MPTLNRPTRNNSLSQPTYKRLSGYSLGEMMIVIGILALASAIGVPSYQGYTERARQRAAMADMGEIQLAIEEYLLYNRDGFPDSLAEIGKDGLEDPWGNPYRYLNIEGGANRGQVRKNRNLVPLNTDYDLYSSGKDGESRPPLTAKHSRDDIVRANNGAFIGPVDEY